MVAIVWVGNYILIPLVGHAYALAAVVHHNTFGSFAMKYQYLIVLIIMILSGGSYYLGYTPPIIGIMLLLLSIFTYLTYARDKSAAQAGNWRVSENTLHLLSVLGGWSGALVAQQRLRHKTRKMSFQVVFWVTVVVNLSALIWLHSAQGQRHLHHTIYLSEKTIVMHVHSEPLVSTWLLLTRFRNIY